MMKHLLLLTGLFFFNHIAFAKQVITPEISVIAENGNIPAFVKGNNNDDGKRVITITLLLSGKRSDARNFYDVQFAIPEYLQLQSHPIISSGQTTRIKKESFSENGSSVQIQVPVTLQLQAINSSQLNENFSIIKAGDPHSAYILFVTSNHAPAGNFAMPNAGGHGFTFTCGKNIFYVYVSHDSIVVKTDDRNVSCYYVPSVFKSADFVLWLTAKYADKLTPDCAAHLASDVSDEMVFDKQALHWYNNDNGNTFSKNNVNNFIHIERKTTAINPVYSKDSVRIEKIRITLVREKPALATDTDHITLKVDKKLFPFSPVIFPSTLTLAASDWRKGEDRSTFDTVIYLKNIRIDSSLKQDATAYLEIDGDEKFFHTIRLTENGMYSPTQPFWLELGTNFDLLNGIDPNNFYSGIYMFDQDVAMYKKHTNLSFTAGVYESKSSSNTLSSDSGFIYRDATSFNYDTAHKGFPYYRSVGPLTTVTTVTNIGFFFSPYLRLNDKPVKQNGFHWFISLYAEMLWQRVATTIDYSKTRLDTTMYIRASNSRDTSIYNYPFKESHYSSDFRSHYLGIGLPIYIKETNYNFYLNTVFGVSTQKFILVESPAVNPNKYVIDTFPNGKLNTGIVSGYATPKHFLNPFYLFQFKLNEEKYGITITGEIRGLIDLPGAKPVVAFSLSKKFDLGELFTSIVKPFSPGK